MNVEFITKLKATLDAMIAENKALKARISALEHTVNDVIIGGLTDAANEYADNEAYSEFVDTYGERFRPFEEPSKILYGDDYDLSCELFDLSRNKPNVEDIINGEINALQTKLDKLRAIKNETAHPEEEVVIESDVPVDPSELERIAKEYL